MGSMMVASTKTLQFISVTVKSNFVIQNYSSNIVIQASMQFIATAFVTFFYKNVKCYVRVNSFS